MLASLKSKTNVSTCVHFTDPGYGYILLVINSNGVTADIGCMRIHSILYCSCICWPLCQTLWPLHGRGEEGKLGSLCSLVFVLLLSLRSIFHRLPAWKWHPTNPFSSSAFPSAFSSSRGSQGFCECLCVPNANTLQLPLCAWEKNWERERV